MRQLLRERVSSLQTLGTCQPSETRNVWKLGSSAYLSAVLLINTQAGGMPSYHVHGTCKNSRITPAPRYEIGSATTRLPSASFAALVWRYLSNINLRVTLYFVVLGVLAAANLSLIVLQSITSSLVLPLSAGLGTALLLGAAFVVLILKAK